MHLKGYCIDHRLLRTGSANFSRSGETRHDNDLVALRGAFVCAGFEAKFDKFGLRAKSGSAWSHSEKPGPPTTLANTRKNGVSPVMATCQACGHKADVKVDPFGGLLPSRAIPASPTGPSWHPPSPCAAAAVRISASEIFVD
jgi:hypothetical protein